MEKLNIADLIEKNSITRLTKDYENKFLIKIKENFNDNQQQLFVASFYCFLNYDKKNDFVIDFDNVWKWLGFSRKDPAKRLLEKSFTLEVDYKIIFHRSVENKIKVETRGRKEEHIMLNINTFKKFCLKADTKKAEEVHDYYIKLEELLQETVNEETRELKEQLYLKNNEIDEKNSKISELSKYVIRKFTTKFKLGNCVYFIKSSEIKDKIKIGSTININYRISDLSTGSPEYFEVVELFYTEFHVLLEKSIKEIFGKYRISVNCEWFDISVIDEIKNFVISQIELYNIYKKNSNINTICDLVVDVPIYVNEKECVDCKQVLNHKFFFFVNKDARIYYEKCISCYEKENGSDKKQCSKCVKIKDKIEFIIDKTKKDGLTYECKDCRNEFQRDRKKELKEKNKDVGKINCTKCNEFKLEKMFFILNDDVENIQYSEECKECYCEEHGNSKQCFTCKEIKLFKFYGKNSITSDGYETYCKACRKIKRDKESSEKRQQEKNNNKKQCTKCQEFLKFNMFLKYIDKDGSITGYYDECINCYDSLQCNKCNIIKEKTQFSKDSSKRTGYRTICKLCTNNG
jgi:hypothetical protein